MLIRDRDGGKGGERVKAQLRTLTQKTEEAMVRCQNNGNVKAVSPCHCCFNCYAGHQERTHPSGTYTLISGTLSDTGVHRHKTKPIFIQDWTQSFDLETGSTYKHTDTHIYMLASK